ncbi:hypothetical protein ABL840_00020 [Variovorax sp. NFACC27]|uniref:hypothetical protein n=1 Tax=unclassified Variovorax TaxID=663243 RepID=UPI00089AB7D8|nr:hypothetical protein SAMN03159371_01211 [Variovorax sp. NFACC28]SEF95922.1 hypothetical protein SAMN03159365_01030 [Variovorax sp. NFACC29]SFB92269.1 hypothetical protein SAMN03159379_01029 [Variovorax sp. NFACC26]SFF82409.1 hypothetical protein SAMN03159447_00394 [Variovorax sp. NFACC27]
MTYFEFIDQLARTLGIRGKDVVWVIPSGGSTPNRPAAFELFWTGLHEGRLMRISKVVREADAPAAFAAFFSIA